MSSDRRSAGVSQPSVWRGRLLTRRRRHRGARGCARTDPWPVGKFSWTRPVVFSSEPLPRLPAAHERTVNTEVHRGPGARQRGCPASYGSGVASRNPNRCSCADALGFPAPACHGPSPLSPRAMAVVGAISNQTAFPVAWVLPHSVAIAATSVRPRLLSGVILGSYKIFVGVDRFNLPACQAGAFVSTPHQKVPPARRRREPPT